MLQSRRQPRLVPAVTPPTKITQLLAEVFNEEREPTVGGIVDGIKDRGFGFLLVVLALPTLVPILPPGSATAIGFLYVLLALQMLCGAERPWLPERIRAYQVPKHIVPKLRQFGLRVFGQIERISRPRAMLLPDYITSRIVASAVLFIGLVLLSPLPFLHTLPGVTVLILGAGLLNRDGVLILGGLILATMALGIVTLGTRVLYVLGTRVLSVFFRGL
ncbi:MAG TPA: exopolysaccharide biosynthesis protein [bacterium]|nr:exopolysaccharide biosynthesis protein [bacterium]